MQHERQANEVVELEVMEVIQTDGTGEVIAEEILIEVEDIVHHGKHGTHPKKAKSYRIMIDRMEKVVHQHEMTCSSMVALVCKTAQNASLTEKVHGGKG